MYETRHAGVKGFGAFATRPIPRGTRIISERPLLAVDSERHVFAATRALSERDRSALLRLSISPIRRSSVLSWTETAWHVTRHAVLDIFRTRRDDGAKTRLPSLIRTIGQYPTILNVFRNNNFDLGRGNGQAVFHDTSRLNHACVPNAQGLSLIHI